MTFGDKIKSLRLQAGLTQEALAAKMGVKKQSISRYEKSEREPNIRTAKKLADALGVSLEALVTNDSGAAFIDEDSLDSELIRMLTSLTPEEEAKVTGYIQGLIANRN